MKSLLNEPPKKDNMIMKLYNKNTLKDIKDALMNENLQELRTEPETYIA